MTDKPPSRPCEYNPGRTCTPLTCRCSPMPAGFSQWFESRYGKNYDIWKIQAEASKK